MCLPEIGDVMRDAEQAEDLPARVAVDALGDEIGLRAELATGDAFERLRDNCASECGP